MKFLPLIWSGFMRKPVRSALTLLSVMVAFILAVRQDYVMAPQYVAEDARS